MRTPTAPGATSSFSTCTFTALHALVQQHHLGEALGDRLDELDMAGGEDHFYRIHDDVIGEDRAHVVAADGDARHIDVDIEAHALRAAALEIIGADLDRNDEVAHEHVIDLAAALAALEKAASDDQRPVDISGRPRAFRSAREAAEGARRTSPAMTSRG